MIPIGTLCVDRVKPTAAFTSPGAGATVSGVVTVAITASDNDAVASVQFYIDGAAIGGLQTTAPFQTTDTSTARQNGAHTYSAVVTDRVGNQTTITQNVTFSNKPVVTITQPGNGANFSGSMNFRATITHYSSSCSSQFSISGYGNVGGAQAGSGDLGFNGLDSHYFTAGSHTFTVVATDAQGNSTTASVSANCTNALPGSGTAMLGDYQENWGGSYSTGRSDVWEFNNRFAPDFIWSQTGNKTGPVYLPGNPDPTHYQMYCQAYAAWAEVGVTDDVHYDLMLDGNRYSNGFRGASLGGNFGAVIAINGGDYFYFERYQDPSVNSCYTTGMGCAYWFGLKSGYQS